MREIQIHFGNEDASKVWVADTTRRSLAATKRLCKSISKIPAKDRHAAIDALRDLIDVFGEMLLTQVEATEGLKKEIPAVIEALISFEAREKAMRRIAKDKDGKQAAKADAHRMWLDWQRGHTLHRSGAAFHRHVCGKRSEITSIKTVERWCKEWLEASKK